MSAKLRIPPVDALPRERLEALAGDAWRHRLTLVVAPAGSGKTTLLARLAAGAAVPVAWYRAETWDAEEAAFLRYLEASLTGALPGLAGGWRRIEDAARALEAWPGGPALLVVDDLHFLEGTAAETALGRLVEYAPAWLAIVLGSRVAPDYNLPRLRVSGDLLEIGPDELRFRAWEVESLFRDFYRDPVPPAELAAIARRTEGWAAGLQLFHLATRGKSADERRRILSGAGSSGRLVREYLARNVLAELPAELRGFLVQTSVLGRLSGTLCDRLLEQRGSGAILDELAARQIFTVALDDDDGSYRYHEVLRAHLDRILVEELGETEARARHATAGRLLEEAGAIAEALGAYCRAEDWPNVRRLLGGEGERLAGEASAWIESLPPAIVRHDPWLTLAAARRARAEGRWAAALDAYARAELGFGASAAALVPRRERSGLVAWLDPVAIPPADWTGLLRAGMAREPLAVAKDLAGVPDTPVTLVRGLLALTAGEVADARRDLAIAVEDPDLSPALAIVARVADAVAATLAGDADASRALAEAAEMAERSGQSWLGRIARVAILATGSAGGSGTTVQLDDDPWGHALGALAAAWGAAPSDAAMAERRLADAERAVAGFRRLGAGALEAWARGIAALALAGTGAAEAREAALGAESFARTTGTPGPRLLAYTALADADPARTADYDLLIDAVRRETGLGPPAGRRRDVAPDGAASSRDVPMAPGEGDEPGYERGSERGADGDARVVGDPVSVRVRTLGGFALELDGRRVPLDRLKPRPRAVLRLLALHAGAPVHREVICEALWPEADVQTGGRSLHVAISSLRGVLVGAGGPPAARMIVREGDAYRLDVPAAGLDLLRFDRAIAEGRAARVRGEVSAAAFGLALEIHAGDLLPEDGPAEWVVEPRERYRTAAVEAARSLAEEALMAGDLEGVVRACQRGLEVDRTYDPLWRLLIDARERAGDAGAASRERREYEVMLAGLGVAPAPVAVGPA